MTEDYFARAEGHGRGQNPNWEEVSALPAHARFPTLSGTAVPASDTITQSLADFSVLKALGNNFAPTGRCGS